jgi:outer membrane protein assembly factor BamB
VNKKIFFSLILIFLTGCSFNKNSKIWNEKNDKFDSDDNFQKVISEEKIKVGELNPLIKIDLSDITIIDRNLDYQNNLGALKYSGALNKMSTFRFSKFENFDQLNLKPLFLKNGLIFFNKKGSIIFFDNNQKILWKENYYSKFEKKLSPKMSFAIEGNNLIIADNIGKYYLINVNNGELIWMKNNIYPFNSEIKKYGDKFFVVDYKNILRCFNLNNGSECWNFATEDSLTISTNKYSIITHENLVIFNNSIGDITAIDIDSGLIQWQLPTQSNKIINETYNFKNSKLVGDKKSIFFSNSKNQFYSVDINTGIPKWINNISSYLTPFLVGKYIFTVSEDGYLYTIQKNKGNIIRINDIYKFYKTKERKKIQPIGITIGQDKLYLTNNDGRIIIVDLGSGKVIRTERISRGQISKPFIFNENLFLIKNGSIIKYN